MVSGTAPKARGREANLSIRGRPAARCEARAAAVRSRSRSGTNGIRWRRYRAAFVSTGLRPINFGKRASPVRRHAVQPAKRCFTHRPISDRTPRARRRPRAARLGGLATSKPDGAGAGRASASASPMSIHAATPAASALRRHCATARGSMSEAKIDGADGARAHAVARAGAVAARSGRRTTRASGSRSFWLCPGAISAAESAASIAIVPEPHIGSSSGVPGVQPASASTPERDSRATAQDRLRAASRA